MQYIVFSRSRNADGNFINNILYNGVSKTDAINQFTTQLNTSFNITSTAKTLYFTGFDSDLAFLKDIKNLTIQDITGIQLSTVLHNLNLATCSNVLTVSGYKPQISIEHDCEECDCTDINVRKNAFGNYLCADCWAEYLATEDGLVEYYLGIANGSYSKHAFSTADLEAIQTAWSTKNNKLGKTDAELALIETNYRTVMQQ